MSTLERRLTTIMFTDMVGYSALSQQQEALALELLEEHRAILRSAFVRHGGPAIEAVGDGFFAEFPSALAGVQYLISNGAPIRFSASSILRQGGEIEPTPSAPGYS